MAEFTPITTQDEFDTAISARLQREKDKYKDYMSPEDVQKKYKDYLSPDQVSEKYKDYLAPDQATELNNKIKEYETSSVKMRIALEKGLPPDLADRIQGTDEESMKADADKLAAYAKPQTDAPTAPPYNPEPEVNPNDKNSALKKMLSQMKEG
ncbi:MAG: DUF4355 domain-containing protein [Bacteroidales bacterium]|nr:DUF4355 domain-containing protein [Bacteroidales bacterium]